MTKSNLQVRIPSEMEEDMDRLSLKSRSAFVREAIQEKIQKEHFRRMEKIWIDALKKNPDSAKEDQAWFTAEAWGPK